jgi:hypothetical protein
MTAKRRALSSAGPSGGAAVFGVLLVIGLIVKLFWWLLAAAAAVGLFFAVRALVRYVQERRTVAAPHDQVFASPSAAGAVIIGRSANGRTIWKVEGTEMSYGTWQNQGVEEASEANQEQVTADTD